MVKSKASRQLLFFVLPHNRAKLSYRYCSNCWRCYCHPCIDHLKSYDDEVNGDCSNVIYDSDNGNSPSLLYVLNNIDQEIRKTLPVALIGFKFPNARDTCFMALSYLRSSILRTQSSVPTTTSTMKTLFPNPNDMWWHLILYKSSRRKWKRDTNMNVNSRGNVISIHCQQWVTTMTLWILKPMYSNWLTKRNVYGLWNKYDLTFGFFIYVSCFIRMSHGISFCSA